MKFQPTRGIRSYNFAHVAGASLRPIISWNANDRFNYHLSLTGHDAYELVLNKSKNETIDEFEIPDVGIVAIGVIREWDQIGPAFLTNMRSAGIIVACKIVRALAPVSEADTEAAKTAVRAIADEYGGVRILSEVCDENVMPIKDREVCMIDRYFRRKREQDE